VDQTVARPGDAVDSEAARDVGKGISGKGIGFHFPAPHSLAPHPLASVVRQPWEYRDGGQPPTIL